MNNTMQSHVQNLAKKFVWDKLIKTGKVSALSFSFPSVNVDENSFNTKLLEVVNEYVDMYIEAGVYSPNLSDLELPSKITDKTPFSGIELSKKVLNESIISVLQVKLMELNILGTQSAVYGESVSQYKNEVAKFSATLLLLKEQLPQVYKECMVVLKASPHQYALDDILDGEKKPGMDVLSQVKLFNEKFVMENYPKEFKEMAKFAKESNFIHTKFGK